MDSIMYPKAWVPRTLQVRYKRWLELFLFKITVCVIVLFKLQPGGHVAKEPLVRTVTRLSKPSATEMMGKRKTIWCLLRTQSICWEFSGRAFSLVTLPLDTCLCLHCLLLVSKLLKDEDLPYSHPCSQSLAWCPGHHRCYWNSESRDGGVHRG